MWLHLASTRRSLRSTSFNVFIGSSCSSVTNSFLRIKSFLRLYNALSNLSFKHDSQGKRCRRGRRVDTDLWLQLIFNFSQNLSYKEWLKLQCPLLKVNPTKRTSDWFVRIMPSKWTNCLNFIEKLDSKRRWSQLIYLIIRATIFRFKRK